MDGSALSDEFRVSLRNHKLPVTRQRLAVAAHGFTRSSHRLVIHGMCAACRGES